MTVLAQIVKLIPAKIIDSLAKSTKFRPELPQTESSLWSMDEKYDYQTLQI